MSDTDSASALRKGYGDNISENSVYYKTLAGKMKGGDAAIRDRIKGLNDTEKARHALVKTFTKLFGQIAKLNKSLSKVEPSLPKMKMKVKALQDGNSDMLDKLLTVVDDTVNLLFIAGSFADITAGAMATESYVILGVGYAEQQYDQWKRDHG